MNKEKQGLIGWLDNHFEETLLVILLIIIAVVSMAQVFFRFLPFLPTLKWAEEFCRFAWIWSVFLSLPYTIKNANMLRVAILLDLMPQALRKVWNILVDIVTTVSMAYLGYHSIPVVQGVIASAEKSPAMLWPMWIVYIILPIGFFLGALRGVQMILHRITHFNEKVLTTTEQTLADAQEEAAVAVKAEGGDK